MTAAGEVESPFDPDIEDRLRELVAEALGASQDPFTGRAATYETYRQLGHQITKGRKVTLWWREGEDPITGYVAGWDSPTVQGGPLSYLVLIPTDDGDFVEELIPQQGTKIRLHMEETLQGEPCRRAMERKLTGFRYFVGKRVLPRGSGPREDNDT